MKPISEKSFTLHNACTLDTADTIVGDLPLAWSEDNCIAAATCQNAIVYELNPLKNTASPDMFFKVQTINCSSMLDYDAGVQEFIDNYETARSLTLRDAAAPDFEIYRTFLDPSLAQIECPEYNNSGIKAVLFSPKYCTAEEGTVLGILTMGHRLLLYVKSSDGTMIQWTMAIDISKILVDILTQNDKYFPNIPFPEFYSPLQSAWEKQKAACISIFAWSRIFEGRKNNEKWIYLVTGTKNNFALIWKLELPITATSNASVLSYKKVFNEGVIKNVLVFTVASDELMVAVGNADGRVICLRFDTEGNLIKKVGVWAEKDELAAASIDWRESCDSGFTSMVIAKGCLIVHLKLNSDLDVVSTALVRNVHVLPITNIAYLGEQEWISASRDGTVAKIWMEKIHEGANEGEMKSEILMQPNTTTLFHETIHHVMLSPNKAFIAILRSKPKVSRSIMIHNTSFLDVKIFTTGVKAFETLCCKPKHEDMPESQTDTMEAIRLHLLRKEFAASDTDRSMLRNCLNQFLTLEGDVTPVKWCLAKICAGVWPEEQKYAELLGLFDKKLVIMQMLKVLGWWATFSGEDSSFKLPVREITSFLISNESLMSEQGKNTVHMIGESDKFSNLGDEICDVTGEKLIFSDDAKFAITEFSRIQWPRCCLTFCAIQALKNRKCEISGSRALNIESNNLKTFLRCRSIYSGLPMI